ncbi:MAG: c-type cytochrome biogenesis protein CcmI [Porticoccaceae bacterium]
MTLWFLCTLLALAAVVFVLWRVIFPAGDVAVFPASDLEANRELLLEESAALAEQRQRGEITEQQYQDMVLEKQRQFLADNPAPRQQAVTGRGGRWLIVVLALLAPLVAVSIYLSIGATEKLKLGELLAQRTAVLSSSPLDQASYQALSAEILVTLNGLAARHDDDPLYPVLLARLHLEDGAYAAAAEQYARVVTLLPDDGEFRAELAQALFLAAGNRATAAVRRETEMALRLLPQNQTALGLMGISHFQAGEYQGAIDYWKLALAQLPADAPSRMPLMAGISAAQTRLGGEADSGQAQVAPGALSVDVSLDADIDVAPDTTVFVYARAWQGSPMPLAIKRLTVADLPLQVVLDDSMAMTPAATLSAAGRVEVVARVSLSGQPAAAPGDYQGSLGPVDIAETEAPLRLSISDKVQ